MRELLDYLRSVAPEITVLGAMTLVQISPLKLNPWSWIAKLIRRVLGTDALHEQINHVENRINNLEIKFDEEIGKMGRSNARTRSKVIRKEIIDFAEELRRGERFAVAEFEEVGRLVNEYRSLIKEYGFKNAYCEAQMDYIEDQMKERGVSNEAEADE